MVDTLRFELALADEVMFTFATEHFGRSTAPAGELVSEQLRFTIPVKPAPGVTITVELPVRPGVTSTAPPLLSEKEGEGGGLTVSANVVVAVIALLYRSVPVTVTE